MSIKDRFKKGALVSTGKKDGQPSKGTALRRTASTAIQKPTEKGANALAKVSQRMTEKKTGNIGFIIDATGSRQSAWVEAQKVQRKMFEKAGGTGNMQLRLVHFGGDTVTDHKWHRESDTVAGIMAEVVCCPGMTQIVPSLMRFIDDETQTEADSIILVGDSFEEDMASLIKAAEALKAKRIKVYAYLDGKSIEAEEAFRKLAEITGGSFAKFGANMPLEDLVVGAAVMTLGGKGALQKLAGNKAVGLLADKSGGKKPTPKKPSPPKP
jgi:hypothetical protein